ncbi:MAG: PilZ domain-containing protein [Deltaproteobacteria bacterium]|nr:MAG: PilZ domain-containing protein [Deltaproteobacteria bacterium]
MRQLTDPEETLEHYNFYPQCFKTHQNRRASPRAPITLFVCCQQDGNTTWAGIAYNLSIGGIAIRTRYPVNVGERFRLEFLLPDTQDFVKVEGEVTWRKFHLGGSRLDEIFSTTGIKFLGLYESYRPILEKCI